MEKTGSNPPNKTPFKMSQKECIYLGVEITPNIDNIVSAIIILLQIQSSSLETDWQNLYLA